MKKILIPTDFSQSAGDAMAYAFAFLGNQPAKIHIVHSVSASEIPDNVPGSPENLKRRQKDFAREQMKALEKYGQGNEFDKISVTTQVVTGHVSPNLKQVAKEFDADLIIMGTPGESQGRLDKWFGTISTNVIDDAPCPIILLPTGYKYQAIDNVIFSTAINHDDPFELWKAMEAIQPHSAIIQCLHVVKTKEETRSERIDEFKKFMESQSPSIMTNFVVEVGDNIEETIEKFAEDTDAEMIIMHQSKRGFWKNLFNSSRATRIVSGIKLPLLVVN